MFFLTDRVGSGVEGGGGGVVSGFLSKGIVGEWVWVGTGVMVGGGVISVVLIFSVGGGVG